MSEPVIGPAVEAALRDVETRRSEAARRLWAAMMLTPSLDVCGSILRGLPVRVDTLDPAPLRRALRGAAPPPGTDYIIVTDDMLDAIDECGSFVVVKERPR